MAALYADARIPEAMAEAMFISDKAWFLKSQKIAKEIDKKVSLLEAPLLNTWFLHLVLITRLLHHKKRISVLKTY